MNIDKQTQRCLLQIVEQTLFYVLDNKEIPTIQQLPVSKTTSYENCVDIISQRFGAFVTLKQHDRLRGCVGCVVANRPLVEQIIYQANNAGFNDQRFTPITHQDMKNISLEISVLSPARRIDTHEQIDIHKHGIILEKNDKRALFLPKVAKEHGWTLEHTLSRLCDKAGLDVNEWRKGANYEVFEAFEFKQ